MRGGDDLCRVVEVRGHGIDGGALGGNRFGEHGLDDRLLGVEVVIEGPEAHIRLFGDLVDPCVIDSLAGEHRARCVDLLAAGPLATTGVTAGMRLWAYGGSCAAAHI